MPKKNKGSPEVKAPQIGKLFGDFLIEKGLITEEKRDDALAVQKAVNLRLGILASMDEIISVAQIYEVLERQRLTGKPFGETARELYLIDEGQLGHLLKRQNSLKMKVGDILVGLLYLKKEAMEAALEHFIREHGQ